MNSAQTMYVLVANGIVSLISFVGLATLGAKRLASKKTLDTLVGFAAGVLLATAMLDLLPEVLESIDPHMGLSWAMGGIVAAFLLERLLLWHHHHDGTHGVEPKALLVIVGDAIHNFIDGVAIAAAFAVSPMIGLTAVAAIIAHEIPQEIADFSVLTHSGMSLQRALFWNFMSALMAVFGGVAGIFFLKTNPLALDPLVAITGGIFIYVACADLIPELHQGTSHSNTMRQIISFFSGIGIIFALGMVAH